VEASIGNKMTKKNFQQLFFEWNFLLAQAAAGSNKEENDWNI
jgi:hypothetical protein